MTNITTLKVGTLGHPTISGETKVYVVDNIIDYAKALTAKGSALGATDTIEAIQVPIGSLILAAGVEQIVAGNSTTLTLDLGYTGGDVDEFVDGFDAQASAAGTFSPSLDVAGPVVTVVGATADTIDLLFATLTGTLTTGKVRVWAMLADISGGNKKQPGIVQLGS